MKPKQSIPVFVLCIFLIVGFSGQVGATHAYKLGIRFQPIGMGTFLVTELQPGGNGAKAGLMVNDHIVVTSTGFNPFSHSLDVAS